MSQIGQDAKETDLSDDFNQTILNSVLTALEKSLARYDRLEAYTQLQDLLKETMEIRIVMSRNKSK